LTAVGKKQKSKKIVAVADAKVSLKCLCRLPVAPASPKESLVVNTVDLFSAVHLCGFSVEKRTARVVSSYQAVAVAA